MMRRRMIGSISRHHNARRNPVKTTSTGLTHCQSRGITNAQNNFTPFGFCQNALLIEERTHTTKIRNHDINSPKTLPNLRYHNAQDNSIPCGFSESDWSSSSDRTRRKSVNTTSTAPKYCHSRGITMRKTIPYPRVCSKFTDHQAENTYDGNR